MVTAGSSASFKRLDQKSDHPLKAALRPFEPRRFVWISLTSLVKVPEFEDTP
ncbi:hypothetical protein FD24_GL001321 [Lactiplantibacillus pentosus DSM 20314]|uniref:Uncharacterized protein n=1 Tax=Lactiplantibacillus pentosus DSM 20314 TaxID=1423791 RepID=A0A837R8S4_LACPE|nr:hypothetical protein FD24_GL001321 [Lactiplantibacillus pentosus DSM 20314]